MKGLRQSFQEEIKAVEAAKLVFVDESGVNRAMSRLIARSPRGERAFGTAPRNWGFERVHPWAMSLGGPLATMCVNGATDGAVFLTYLKEMLVPKLWQGAVVVVLDNLGAHKVKGVKELVESAGARLLYLPPYSPDLNPIEMAWSKPKNSLRRAAARTTEALEGAIRPGLAAISGSDAQGFFAHAGYKGSLKKETL